MLWIFCIKNYVCKTNTISTQLNSEISEDEARECLVEYVSKKCCYGKSAAKKMKMKDIISSSALHVCYF